MPLLLFDQGQNQDRLLRLRQGPKVSLFFCLVLFCFVFSPHLTASQEIVHFDTTSLLAEEF